MGCWKQQQHMLDVCFAATMLVQLLLSQETPLQQLLSQRGKAPHKGSDTWTLIKMKTGAQSDVIPQLLCRQVVAKAGASLTT